MNDELKLLLTERVKANLTAYHVPHTNVDIRLEITSRHADVYHAHVDLDDHLEFPQLSALHTFMDHLTVDRERDENVFQVKYDGDMWYLGDGDDVGAAWIDVRKGELIFWIRRFK